jgi:hypothetical protein
MVENTTETYSGTYEIKNNEEQEIQDNSYVDGVIFVVQHTSNQDRFLNCCFSTKIPIY